MARNRHHFFLQSLPRKHVGQKILLVTHGNGLYASVNILKPPVILKNPGFCCLLKYRYGVEILKPVKEQFFFKE